MTVLAINVPLSATANRKLCGTRKKFVHGCFPSPNCAIFFSHSSSLGGGNRGLKLFVLTNQLRSVGLPSIRSLALSKAALSFSLHCRLPKCCKRRALESVQWRDGMERESQRNKQQLRAGLRRSLLGHQRTGECRITHVTLMLSLPSPSSLLCTLCTNTRSVLIPGVTRRKEERRHTLAVFGR